MSKRSPSLYLLDILIAHNKITRYIEKFTNSEDFFYSELEWDATIRELEIVGEATNNLIKVNILNNKNRRIVDFRNEIAHGYFGINAEIVLDVCRNKLTQYTKELKKISLEDILEAIELSKEEHKGNLHILNLLNTLQQEYM